MSWKDEVEELARRRELARAQGGADAVARQHERGRLTVRERIAALESELLAVEERVRRATRTPCCAAYPHYPVSSLVIKNNDLN